MYAVGALHDLYNPRPVSVRQCFRRQGRIPGGNAAPKFGLTGPLVRDGLKTR